MANGYSDTYASPWLQSPSQPVGRRRTRRDEVAIQPIAGGGGRPTASAPAPGGAPGSDLFGLRPWAPSWGVQVDDGSGVIGNGVRPRPEDGNVHVDPEPGGGEVGIPPFGRGGDPNMPVDPPGFVGGIPVGDLYGARRPPFDPNGGPFWPTPEDGNSPWLQGRG